jgi:uncharacterized protein YvpB
MFIAMITILLFIVADLYLIHTKSSSAIAPAFMTKLEAKLTNTLPIKAASGNEQTANKEQAEKEEAIKEKQAAKEEQAAKVEAAKEQAAKEEAAKEEAAKAQAAAQAAAQQQGKILDVPLIDQLSAPGLYNGCEVTSLAMILNYNGFHVTKNELADNIARVPLTYQSGLKGNPNVGFVGNMEVGPGYAVYNGPIYNLAKRYAGNEAVNLTGSSFETILDKVNQGEPVWIITTETFAPVSDFETWHTPQGTISISFSEHSVVITGYDPNYIYINNPYGQKNQKLNRTRFEEAWEQMGSQAVVIEK